MFVHNIYPETCNPLTWDSTKKQIFSSSKCNINHNLGYEILDNGSLKLWRPEVTDSGIYICVAENNAGRALGQVRLVVQGRKKKNISFKAEPKLLWWNKVSIDQNLELAHHLFIHFSSTNNRGSANWVYKGAKWGGGFALQSEWNTASQDHLGEGWAAAAWQWLTFQENAVWVVGHTTCKVCIFVWESHTEIYF